MASKKAVKRKTVWRTLSIGAEEAAAAASAADKAGTSAALLTAATTQPPLKTAVDGVEPAASGTRNAASTGSNSTTCGGPQQSVRTTSSHNHQQYDGRSKPFAPYNRHHSSSSSAFHSNSKFTRRPSAYNSTTDTTSSSVPTTTATPSDEASLAASNATTAGPSATQRWSGNAGQRSSAGRSDRFGGRSANGAGASVNGTTTTTTTTSGYRRRPFNPRFYNGNTRSTFRIHRQQDGVSGEQTTADAADAEKNATKPLFNEDDYTRITTPRQDVLFKKGYLSRPKPYAASALPESAGTGMEDVLVLTPEEAIAAGLMHGYDPENPYVGFYDATGMFYVNPYMNNGGVDPYTGQMMVLPPYGTDPYMADGTPLPSDVILPQFVGEMCGVDEHPVNTIEEIPADCPTDDAVIVDQAPVEYATVSEVPVEYAGEPLPISSPEQSQDGDEPISTDESQGGATSKGNEGDGEETTPDVTIDGSATDAPTISMPAFYPQIFYPYVFGAPAPYVPVNDMDGNASYAHPYESGQSKFNRFRRRKRKPFRYPSSTGTTTTDYSEDDEHHDHNCTAENNFHTDASIDEVLLRTNLHADCSEFVPREFTAEEFLAPSTPPPSPTPSLVRNTTLNVHVPEFRPRGITTTATTLCHHSSSNGSGTDVAGVESDDSGVSTTEAQPSAPITPEPTNAVTLIDDSQFPSIGGGVVSDLDAAGVVETESKPSGWSYAAIAQRPPVEVVMAETTVKTEQCVATAKTSVVPAKTTRKSTRSTANVAPETASAKPKSKTRSKGVQKSSPKKRDAVSEPTVSKAAIEAVQSDVLPPKQVAEVIVETNKSAQLSFADLLRPTQTSATVTEPIVVASVKTAEQRTVGAAIAAESKPVIAAKVETAAAQPVEATPEPPVAVAPIVTTTWQTIRVNGKKRMVQHIESADFWEEPEEPEPVVKVPEVQKLVVNVEIERSVEDQTPCTAELNNQDEDAEEAEPVKTKTKKPKSRKPAKKAAAVKETNKKDHKSPQAIAQNDIVEIDPFPTVDDDLLDVSDLTEYNFVADPNAIFANAIAPAPASLFSSPRGDKFGGVGGLFAASTFDFAALKSPQSSNATLRQEEDMVMRIMRSISSVEASKSAVNGKENGIELIEAEKEEPVALKEEEIEESTLPITNGDAKHCDELADAMKTPSPIDNESKIQSNGHSEPLSNGLAAKSNGHSEENHTPLTNGNHHHHQSIDETTKTDDDHHNDDGQQPTGSTMTAAAAPQNPTTIGISSISHNGNTHGNTIDGDTVVVADAITSIPLQITPDVSPPSTVIVGTSAAAASSDLSDDASTLSSLDDSTDGEAEGEGREDEDNDDDDEDDDSEADDRTVVGPLDEYIEDDVMMIDGSDPDNLLSCGEFYDGHLPSAELDGCLDPLCDGDIDELIKHAEQIVRATTMKTTTTSATAIDGDELLLMADNCWTKTSTAEFDASDDALHADRNESPRSSEDSGILENHDEALASSNESEEAADEQRPPPLDDADGALKCSLTEAVSRWLVEKQKEKSPEPIIRLPDDPALSTQIEKSIQRFQISEMLKSYAVDETDYDDDEDEDDVFDEVKSDYNLTATATTTPASKNSQSNPLAAASANNNGDEAVRRVAPPTTAAAVVRVSPLVSLVDDEPDILEYWDVDPMLTQQQQLERRKRCAAQDGSKSPVNYAQLLSEVGTRTTIDFLMSQQKQQEQVMENGTAATIATKVTQETAAAAAAAATPLNQRIDAKSGEYLKRHQFGCALM